MSRIFTAPSTLGKIVNAPGVMVGLWRSDCAFTLLCVSTLVSISCIDINKKKTANLHLWIDPVLLSQSVNLRVEHLDMLMSRH